MLKKIALLVVANLAFLIGVTAIYAIGYEYDREHKLYPETDSFGDVTIGVYGQRWERTVKLLLTVGGLADAAILLSLYRKRKSTEDTTLDLH